NVNGNHAGAAAAAITTSFDTPTIAPGAPAASAYITIRWNAGAVPPALPKYACPHAPENWQLVGTGLGPMTRFRSGLTFTRSVKVSCPMRVAPDAGGVGTGLGGGSGGGDALPRPVGNGSAMLLKVVLP